jgi:hypothetical protein
MIFIKYYIDDCFHCDRIKGTYSQYIEKNSKKFKEQHVNDSELYNTPISIYPCVICYNKGEEVDRLGGIFSPEKLKEWIGEHDE